MTHNNHLSAEELNQQLIDPGSLSEEQQCHFQQCASCQKQNGLFLKKIYQAQNMVSQNQDDHYSTRRTFWNQTVAPPNSGRTRSKAIITGAIMSVVCSILFLVFLTGQPQNQVIPPTQSQDEPSLLQFATIITPETELKEPDLFTFIAPESIESANNSFDDFILFINSTEQENS